MKLNVKFHRFYLNYVSSEFCPLLDWLDCLDWSLVRLVFSVLLLVKCNNYVTKEKLEKEKETTGKKKYSSTPHKNDTKNDLNNRENNVWNQKRWSALFSSDDQ
jgi:hypothetical protein